MAGDQRPHILGCRCARCARVRQLHWALEHPNPSNAALRTSAKALGITAATTLAAIADGGIITCPSGERIFTGKLESDRSVAERALRATHSFGTDRAKDRLVAIEAEIAEIMREPLRECQRCGQRWPNTFGYFGSKLYKTRVHVVPKDVCHRCEAEAKSQAHLNRGKFAGA